MKSRKISKKDTEFFDRGGFEGNKYIKPENGSNIGVLEVRVHGKHPEKILAKGVRMYRVESGTGTFTLDGQKHAVGVGDLYVIAAGSSYEYEGEMILWEMNVLNPKTE